MTAKQVMTPLFSNDDLEKLANGILRLTKERKFAVYERLVAVRGYYERNRQQDAERIADLEVVPAIPDDIHEAIRDALVQRKHDICDVLDWGISDDSNERSQLEWERLTARYDKALEWLNSVAERRDDERTIVE